LFWLFGIIAKYAPIQLKISDGRCFVKHLKRPNVGSLTHNERNQAISTALESSNLALESIWRKMMTSWSNIPETRHQVLDKIEPSPQSEVDAASISLLEDTLLSKIIYLLAGTVMLAVWWLVYIHLIDFAKFLTYQLLQLQEGSHFGSTIEFFIFEVPKVLMLLFLIVFVVGIIRSYFTPEKTRRILAGNRESVSHVLAGMLGLVTPFCSSFYGIPYGRRTPRRDLFLSGYKPYGQSGCACASFWAIWMESGGFVHVDRAHHSLDYRLHNQSAQHGEIFRRLGPGASFKFTCPRSARISSG
jgi:hypothetical protein